MKMGRFEGFFLSFVLNSFLLFCHGGTTSRFVRRLEATADMPLDSDVFRVPPGCNAPQQVRIHFFLLNNQLSFMSFVMVSLLFFYTCFSVEKAIYWMFLNDLTFAY